MGESKVLMCCVMVKCEVSCSGMCQRRVWAFQGCSSAQWREARRGRGGLGWMSELTGGRAQGVVNVLHYID